MTENKGPTVPMKLSGSVTVSAKTYEGTLREGFRDTIKQAVDRLSTVELVMHLASVSQEQAEWLVSSGIWESYMHRMRIDAFLHFQDGEDPGA